jgi:hypothetical protein
MGESCVVTQRFPIRRLMLFSKMGAARLFPMERVMAKQFGELQEIRDSTRILQLLIECIACSKHRHIAPELMA